MTEIALIILAVSGVTLLGSIYARLTNRVEGLISLYVMFIALSQIMASKIASFDFGFLQVTAPAAVPVFAVTFLLTDIVNERFGRSAVHNMIGIAFITQVVMVLFLHIGTCLPPAPFWAGQEAWNSLFGAVPRITLASWVTFLVSENLDAFLYAWIRELTKGKHLWARNVFSSIPSLTIDTVCFVLLAFAGTGMPLWALMTGQFVTKYAVCIIDIPFMYLNRLALGAGGKNETSAGSGI